MKIPKFSLPWQQGLLDVYFNNTTKLLDLGATFVALFLVLYDVSVKIPQFSLPWQPGRSDENSNDTGKLPDLANPLPGAKFMALCLILAELWLILC